MVGVTIAVLVVFVIGDHASEADLSQPKRTSGRLVLVLVAVDAARTEEAVAPSTR